MISSSQSLSIKKTKCRRPRHFLHHSRFLLRLEWGNLLHLRHPQLHRAATHKILLWFTLPRHGADIRITTDEATAVTLWSGVAWETKEIWKHTRKDSEPDVKGFDLNCVTSPVKSRNFSPAICLRLWCSLSFFYLIEQVEFFLAAISWCGPAILSQRTATTPGTSCPTLFE